MATDHRAAPPAGRAPREPGSSLSRPQGAGVEASEVAKGPAELAGPLLASPVGGPGSSLKDEATVPQGIASVEQLIEWERQLRAKQVHHQAEADDFASWRGRVIQSLRDLHGLSYDSIAHLLGGVTRAQVEYLAKGRKKR